MNFHDLFHLPDRDRMVSSLTHDLAVCHDMLKRLRYKRGHALELMDEIGQKENARIFIDKAIQSWERLEEYLVRYLEAAFHWDDEMRKYEMSKHVSLAQTAVNCVTDFTCFFAKEMKEHYRGKSFGGLPPPA